MTRIERGGRVFKKRFEGAGRSGGGSRGGARGLQLISQRAKQYI